MLKYPTFSKSEYDCLNPNLYVVEFMLKLEQLETDKSLADLQHQNAVSRNTRSLNSVKHALLNTIVSQDMYNPETRQHYLRTRLSEFAETVDQPNRYDNKVKRRRIAQDVKEVYAGLKVDLFEKDFAEISGAQGDEECAALLKEAEKVHHSVSRSMETHWKKLSKCFVAGRLPTMFRGQKALNTGDVDHQELDQLGMAQRVVRAFMADWRARSPLFEVPVSVHGVGIHTMPPANRLVWSQAYDKMQLGKLKKRPVYQFLTEPKTALLPSAPSQSFFSPQESAEVR